PEQLGVSEKFVFAIGNLVMAWANCESLFSAILELLVSKPGNNDAAVIWLSNVNTRARLDLILNLAKARGLSQKTYQSISQAHSRFKSITSSRNFYCHGYYGTENGELCDVDGYRIDPSKPFPVIQETRAIDKALLNEVVHTIMRTLALSDELGTLCHKLRDELKAPHVELPPLPPEPKKKRESRQPPSKEKRRKDPPQSSPA
ncbi:MAG: hypothetical protein LPK88_13535, partial [Alphaproteobacteria bacterium]|nr:hypothetical protein [Alphaproteobacteria bacterium]MDX5417324.1 hypothetical protein [Alphaproteobacteria bacterium]MDX5494780.1 hypothetical protein [Alphaproteobacteria bacterium]